MPLYTYLCPECKEEIEVIRSMSDSDVLPAKDESKESTCEHKWTKIIKHPPQKAYGPGWNTRKGYH